MGSQNLCRLVKASSIYLVENVGMSVSGSGAIERGGEGGSGGRQHTSEDRRCDDDDELF